MPRTTLRPCLLALAGALSGGCTTAVERSVARDLDRIERTLAPLPADGGGASPGDGQRAGDTPTTADFDGTLPPYLAYAFAHNPRVRAAFEAYRAASYDPKVARRLPEPRLTIAGFVRAVETRVGPQRARIGVAQMFPWPSRLVQAGKAAALRARAEGRRFEAVALDVARVVTYAFVAVWRIDRLTEVERRRLAVFEALEASVRARVEVGGADVSDLARLATRTLRSKDRIDALAAQRRAAVAELARALGLEGATDLPVTKAPLPAGLPAEDPAALYADAARHPRVEALAVRAEAERHEAKARAGRRLPSFGLGVDWIITGPARMDPAPADSGKDAVIAMGTVDIPLWQPSYGAEVKKARAVARMYEARRLSEVQAVRAAVDAALARLDDAARRVDLYERTLVAQAKAALASTRAAYAARTHPLADVLDAEEDLIELSRAAVEARADLARAYADLEALVGRPLPRKDPTR